MAALFNIEKKNEIDSEAKLKFKSDLLKHMVHHKLVNNVNVNIRKQKEERKKEIENLIDKSDMKELLKRKENMEKEIDRLDELYTVEE